METNHMPIFIPARFYIPIFTNTPIRSLWFLNIQLILVLMITRMKIRMIIFHTTITIIMSKLMIITIMSFSTIPILTNMITIMNITRFMLILMVIRIIATNIFPITGMGMCIPAR